ncbi:MAG: hypothetical protein E7053_07700 [Lentisphaerae bacterium]|nr:hypothetical protein [Lentisphaerota bacterium]
MKKFLVCFLIFCGVLMLAANDETVVAEAVKDFRVAQLTFDFNKLLQLCSPEYVQVNVDGSQRSYADLQRMAQAMANIEGSDDLEVIVENYWAISGRTLNDEQRELIRQAKDTEFGRNLAAEYKGAIIAVKASYARAAYGRDNWSVTVTLNGDEAEAVLSVPATSGGSVYRTKYKMKKVDGKWLVVRNEHLGAGR